LQYKLFHYRALLKSVGYEDSRCHAQQYWMKQPERTLLVKDEDELSLQHRYGRYCDQALPIEWLWAMIGQELLPKYLWVQLVERSLSLRRVGCITGCLVAVAAASF
jgi:hypothetical protein